MDHTFEQKNHQTEQSSPATTFEHLFTENKYSSLRSFDIRSVRYAYWLNYAYDDSRRLRLVDAGIDDKQFAERENLPALDKTTIFLKLRGCRTISEKPYKHNFRHDNLDDLLHEDEELGGVVTRKISTTPSLGSKIDDALDKLTGTRFLDKEEYIIGVLKHGKPTAIIHFMEGQQPRTRRETTPVVQLGRMPQAVQAI